MDEWDGIEQRRFDRISESFTIYHKSTDMADESANWHISSIINVGIGGLLLASTLQYSAGDKIDILVELEEGEEPLRMQATVRRVAEEDKAGLYETAIEFADMPPEHSQKLESKLNDINGKRDS